MSWNQMCKTYTFLIMFVTVVRMWWWWVSLLMNRQPFTNGWTSTLHCGCCIYMCVFVYLMCAFVYMYIYVYIKSSLEQVQACLFWFILHYLLKGPSDIAFRTSNPALFISFPLFHFIKLAFNTNTHTQNQMKYIHTNRNERQFQSFSSFSLSLSLSTAVLLSLRKLFNVLNGWFDDSHII